MTELAREICNKNLCTGCQACISVCPVHCIEAAEDDEGFLRPKINEKICIDCDLCKKTCPINKMIQKNHHPTRGYLYQTKSSTNLAKCASGGAFQDICRVYLGDYQDIAIFGVELDATQRARFTCVDSLDDVSRFSGSKYVQAEIGETYGAVKKRLNGGARVVFSGTPCQVDGLRHYLGRSYESLLCVDLICHGIGSPKVFDRYLSFLQHRYKSKIEHFYFTAKKGDWLHRRVLAQFETGKEYTRMAITFDDPYMTAFFSHIIMRPSCYSCRYTNLSRVGDITIGDAWGVEKQKVKQYYQNGVSLLIASTDKGANIVHKCSSFGRVETVDLADYVASNPQLQRPIEAHPKRSNLMQLAASDDVPFSEFVKKLQYRSPLRRCLSELKVKLS